MAFYGNIECSALRKIRNRLFTTGKIMSLTEAFFANCDVMFSIERNSYGHHYSHYNTMSVTFETGNGVTEKQYQLLIELRDAILEEIKDVSKGLANYGYKVIESYDEEYARESLKECDILYFYDGKVFDDSYESSEAKALRQVEDAGQLTL
jgi:hypothetical protein